jgi:NitT/TauT family transport system substrate-binding protein/sulfonate transport system substrate-binding protein
MGAEEQGISVEEARQLYRWTEFTASLSSRDIETMEDDIDFMLRNGMIAEEIEPASCIAEMALPD